jgi:hypothetical protein
MTYAAFKALGKVKARDIRQQNGAASKDGPPETVMQSWTPEQKHEVAVAAIKEDPEILTEVTEVPTVRQSMKKAVAQIEEDEMAETIYAHGGNHPDEPVESFPGELHAEAIAISHGVQEYARRTEKLRDRCEPDEWPPVALIIERHLGRLISAVTGLTVPEGVESS